MITKKSNSSLLIIAILSIGLVFINKVQAQSTVDSLQYALQIEVLQSDFQKSVALFQLDKYKLLNPFITDGEVLFEKTWKQYEQVYSKIPAIDRPQYFTEDFFGVVITAAQLYRNISAITMLTEHKQQVMPTSPVHHDKWNNSNNHSTHNNKD